MDSHLRVILLTVVKHYEQLLEAWTLKSENPGIIGSSEYDPQLLCSWDCVIPSLWVWAGPIDFLYASRWKQKLWDVSHFQDQVIKRQPLPHWVSLSLALGSLIPSEVSCDVADLLKPDRHHVCEFGSRDLTRWALEIPAVLADTLITVSWAIRRLNHPVKSLPVSWATDTEC